MKPKNVRRIEPTLIFLLAIVFGLMILGITGCSTFSMTPLCRHEAKYCVSIVGEQYPARIAYGVKNGEPHCQAQGLIKGKWEWLKMDYCSPVTTSELDKDFDIGGYVLKKAGGE